MTKKKIVGLAASLAFLFMSGTSHAGTVTYDGYTFYDNAFADAVISYSQGAGIDPNLNTNPFSALGEPDFVDPWTPDKFVSLGDVGSLTVQFIDNTLSQGGDSFYDLYIFEVGPRVEGMYVWVSSDNFNFYSVGMISGSTAGVDIDQYASLYSWNPTDTFDYVRLVDNGLNQYQYQFPGPDIDSIAANPINPIPLPGAVWLFGSGLLGLIAARKKN